MITKVEDLLETAKEMVANAQLCIAAEASTPEEEHKAEAYKQEAWDNLIGGVEALIERAAEEIFPSEPYVSDRTFKINEVVDEVSKKLIEYPSGPYSNAAADTLNKTLMALQTSTMIDTETERRMNKDA